MDKNTKFAKNMLGYFNQVFKGNSVKAKCVDYVIGATTTRLHVDVQDEKHIKYIKELISKVSTTMDEYPISFIKSVYGSSYSAIELANPEAYEIDFEEAFKELPDVAEHPTAFPLGQETSGKFFAPDIKNLRHILIEGTNASGKTTFINNILSTLIRRTSPEELRLVLIDPTHFEMNPYINDPHLLLPVLIEPIECKEAMNKLVSYMDERYKLFEQNKTIYNLDAYNKWAKENNKETLPYIIVVLNEYSYLSVMSKVINIPLLTLLQKGTGCGIHIILTRETYSSHHVVTNEMKANFTTKGVFELSIKYEGYSVFNEWPPERRFSSSGDLTIKSSQLADEFLMIKTPHISTLEVYEIVKESKEKYKDYSYDSYFKDVGTSESSKDMKELFRGSEIINDDNKDRVEMWAYGEETISVDKIQKELAVSEDEANHYVKLLYNRGIIRKTKESGTYRVIDY